MIQESLELILIIFIKAFYRIIKKYFCKLFFFLTLQANEKSNYNTCCICIKIK